MTAPAPNPAAAQQDPAQRKQQTRRRIIALVVLLMIVGIIAVLAWRDYTSNPDNAAVGDCVSLTGIDTIKVMGCGDAKANYRVVGKVGNKTQADFGLSSAQICQPFPTAKSASWKGKIGQPGYVLCLAPAK